MQISKKDLVRVIQEELSVLGENDLGVTSIADIETQLGASDQETAPPSAQIGVLERRQVYEAAMGLGRAMEAFVELSKAGIISREKKDTIMSLYDEMKNLYAESY